MALASCCSNDSQRMMTTTTTMQVGGVEWKGKQPPMPMWSPAPGDVRKPLQQLAVMVNNRERHNNKNARMADPPAYFSRTSTINIALDESKSPSRSFDQYLEDKPRVFKAICPDKNKLKSHQLNKEEWRIHMLPIQFLSMSASPVLDLRLTCKTNGINYPLEVPPHITKVLELDVIRWEIQGVDDIIKPSQFSLGVKGALYPHRWSTESYLRGSLRINVGLALPPMLALVPQYFLQQVGDSVLESLMESMNDQVKQRLIASYGEFKRENKQENALL